MWIWRFCINVSNILYYVCTLYSTYVLDVLWGQPIKLAQVASTSEFRKNQPNDVLVFKKLNFLKYSFFNEELNYLVQTFHT